VTSCRMKPIMKLTTAFGINRLLLYICVMTSVTVTCLTALAGSGRDNGVREAFDVEDFG
jgi:hypothetical protein